MWVFKIVPTIVLAYYLTVFVRLQLKSTDTLSEVFDIIGGLAVMSLLVLLWA